LDLPESGGGLIVVGSYVPRTTSQVNALLAQPGVRSVEIRVEALLDDSLWQGEIERVVQQADRGETAEGSLSIGQHVSEGLVAIVRMIATRPRYLLAKGGITSSDVATQGLDVKRALVPGQILPGVPVWQLGPESCYPGLAYIIFPGNVGGPQALVEIVTALRPTAKE